MKLNTRPYKVIYKMFGKKHTKGFKTQKDADWYLENVAKEFDNDAIVKVIVV